MTEKKSPISFESRWPDFALLKKLFKRADIKMRSLVFPALLTLGSAVFDGASLGLLMPLAKGVMDMDFSFIINSHLLQKLIPQLIPLIQGSNSHVFFALIVLIFIATLLKNYLKYTASILLSKQVYRFQDRLRQLIFSRYLSFGKNYFDRNNIGHLNNVLMVHTDKICNVIRNLQSLLASFLTFFVYLIIMFVISWPLTFLSAAVFPVFYYGIGGLLKKIRRDSRAEFESRNEQSRQISNSLLAIPLIKAYTREDKEKTNFFRLSKAVTQAQLRIAQKQELIGPVQEIISVAALIFLISVIAFLYFRTSGSEVSGFLVFLVILRRGMGSLGSFNQIRVFFAALHAPLAEVSSIFNDNDKFFVSAGAREFAGLRNRIEFCHLDFSYRKESPVLRDLNAVIEKGKVTAIVGETGSGKSTLAHLLLRFYDCPPGAILMDGTDIREFTLQSLGARMAFVGQEAILFNDTLRKNITYGLDRTISETELANAFIKARLEEYISKLPQGLETQVGDRGVKLSGGEKQRVSIARAILKGADILIFDEATSALDSRTERLIQEAIDEAVCGRTAVVIAHRLSTIKHADKIIVLERGQIVESGTLEELLHAQSKFYSYWQEQKFF